MPTSVHIPKNVLAAVDRRARALKMSRNRFVVRALERELARETEWSHGFFDFLAGADPADARLLDESLEEVATRRKSKPPVRL